jgi:nucleotide-binding universal stress UspA family protein
MIVIKNLLVATDFSEPSAAALTYGRALARQFGATLHVLHVVEDVAARVVSFPLYIGDVGHAQMELDAAARKQLDACLTDDDRKALNAQATVLMSSSPWSAIVDYATHTAPPIDLIVIGTHGRGAISQWFMGSVAERVVRAAPCPVLTVRNQEREFVRPDALQTVTHALRPAGSLP